MTSKRLYFVLLGVIGLLFAGLLAGTYGANKLLVTRANHLSSLKAQSLALSDERTTLRKAKQDIAKYDSLEKIVKTIVPEDKDQAEAVRELVNIAADNDVSLGAINFPASTLGSGTKVGASGAPVTIGGAAPSANSKSNALSQLLPVKNIPGVYLLQITVQGDANKPVRYDKFVSFLADLEHNRRTAQVSSITLQPSSGQRTYLNFTLVLNTYIKP
jgi:hypothetical protein